MKYTYLIIFCVCLGYGTDTAQAARDVKTELQTIQEQRKLVVQAQQALANELGEVGRSLKKLDVALLKARSAYRKVRAQIVDVDQHLQELAEQKQALKTRIHGLYQQMIQEASAAYKHSGSHSVWVDVLSDTSITEIPHRQFLLRAAMESQEKDREAWRKAMQELDVIEDEEKTNKENLLALKNERKAAEQDLVSKITTKSNVAKQLKNNIDKKKEQEERLLQQEIVLQRLLDGLGDTLLASDKKTQASSVRKQKGHLPWPLKGRVLVDFGDTTATGVKLTGVHISPAKRTEKGKLVEAFAHGQVRYADWFGGYGLMMIVDYGHGIMAVYAHNDALHKQLGDWVEKGEVLAEAGSTGWIEDIRLYFEIRDNGKPVSPSHWCKK